MRQGRTLLCRIFFISTAAVTNPCGFDLRIGSGCALYQPAVRDRRYRILHLILSSVNTARRPVATSPSSEVLREPVFRPRIGGVAVTAHFPETRLIFGYELDRADELGPFPRVKFRYDDSGRTAMVARDRFTIELCRDQRIIIEGIFKSHISRVTIVTPEKNVAHLRFRFHDLGHGKESDPAPAAIGHAPGSDTV